MDMQWDTLQQLLALAESNKRNVAPGMGSTANALPQQNPMVDDRRYYTDMQEDSHLKSLLGLGGAVATMYAAPGAPPAAVPLALGLGGYGAYHGVKDIYAKEKAKRMAFQGN